VSRYDALDHRTVIGGRHYRTHVHSDIDMGEVEGVTRSEANAPLTIQALIKARQGGSGLYEEEAYGTALAYP
jgi:hypothetical protein